MPFLSGADLSVLQGLSEGLIVLGLVGVVSLVFFSTVRPNQMRLMGVLFTLMAFGGVALIWRIDDLNNADRDLTPDQLAALSESISQLLGVKFEVHILTGDREAQSLATKIIDAVKAGSGTMPHFGESQSLPPGVILVFSVKDTDLRRAISDTVGRRLAAARIAVGADFSAEQPEHTVIIMIGKKP